MEGARKVYGLLAVSKSYNGKKRIRVYFPRPKAEDDIITYP